jgi:hypothetical protein
VPREHELLSNLGLVFVLAAKLEETPQQRGLVDARQEQNVASDRRLQERVFPIQGTAAMNHT